MPRATSTHVLSTLAVTLLLPMLGWPILGWGAPPSNPGSAASPAAPAPGKAPAVAAAERVTSVEGITEYRLANGLRVLLFPDPSKQTITVNITYLVGSRQENYGETGMAHLLEHLMFRGSPRHLNIPKEFTSRGAQSNGTTNYDRTNYFETFTATDQNLRWALDLEADRMVHSLIAKKDLDSEMTVVRNEYEAGENNPVSVLFERIFSTAYLSHSYGHPVIGVRSDIENVPIERLQAYYHLYYQPDNAVLLVSGHIDPARTLALIEQKLGAIPRPQRKLPVFYTQEPPQDGAREVELRRVGDIQVVAAGYHIPSASHPDFAALRLLGTLLAQAPGGRLYKALVESHKAASVFAQARALHDPGLMIVGAQLPAAASLEEARSTLLSGIEQLAQNPPTAAELERARAQEMKEIERALDHSDSLGIELSEWMAAGDWRLFFLYRDRVRAVTPEDIQRVAATYFKAANRTAGVFVPTQAPVRASIPDTPDVAAMVKDYKSDAAPVQGEAFDTSPANIDARTQRAVSGGITLALLPKKTRGSVVVVTMQLDFGDEQSLRGLADVASLCGQMLMRGTVHHSRQELQDEINRLKANVRVGGGPTGATVRIETPAENLAPSLTLAAEMLREPSFPANEFDVLKRQRLTAVEAQRSEPQALAEQALSRHMSPFPKGDVRYTPTLDEQAAGISAVTLDQIKDFHRRFYGASHAELGIAGDFDRASIEPLVKKLFEGWKSQEKYARVPAVYHEVPVADEVIRVADKPNALFMAAQGLQISQDDPDYPALVLGNYLLGGGFISSRLATRIRQKEGLSYTIASQLTVNALDRDGLFRVYAISAPQNTGKVQTAVMEELERALKDGFTEPEVNSAREGWLQARAVGRSQDGALSQMLTRNEYLGRTLAWDAALENHVRALKAQDIVAALRRHINPEHLSLFKAGDFPKDAAAKGDKDGG